MSSVSRCLLGESGVQVLECITSCLDSTLILYMAFNFLIVLKHSDMVFCIQLYLILCLYCLSTFYLSFFFSIIWWINHLLVYLEDRRLFTIYFVQGKGVVASCLGKISFHGVTAFAFPVAS